MQRTVVQRLPHLHLTVQLLAHTYTHTYVLLITHRVSGKGNAIGRSVRPSVRPSVSTLSFEPRRLTFIFACVWFMTTARLELKVKVKGGNAVGMTSILDHGQCFVVFQLL